MTVSEYLANSTPLGKEQALEFESKFRTKKADAGDYLITER